VNKPVRGEVVVGVTLTRDPAELEKIVVQPESPGELAVVGAVGGEEQSPSS